MKHQLKKDLIKFFEECLKTSILSKDKIISIDRFLMELESSLAFFEVANIHREDIMFEGVISPEEWKENVEITDEEMEQIAKEVSKSYIDGRFWFDLEACARNVLKNKLIE